MPEFWEQHFRKKQEMWGREPARSALLARDLFLKQGVKSVLVPGFGYGRNARVFTAAGMHVTGIEISATAIQLAREHFGTDLDVFHGSVTDMPFDDRKYDAVYCHALIHLLDARERTDLIRNCFAQLRTDGLMIFTAVTRQPPGYGHGDRVGPHRYERHRGARIFYYDPAAVQAEFGACGLVDIRKVQEDQLMFLIQCRKP
ncbi:class I SAM-dependent methyltransferase [Neolewinella litorea]|uniref:Class I SAM-dependent methyltransferase n=1 Tax=Neolewinella litorea TaxID=2562452 RepID=A0A4V3XKR8_9BACT|nr:class I SAM-dependent methyltransferase [Neolewinella litorea]THH37973.1 class I SAM-dependent methyltransferase [Neolewinella litorea]